MARTLLPEPLEEGEAAATARGQEVMATPALSSSGDVALPSSQVDGGAGVAQDESWLTDPHFASSMRVSGMTSIPTGGVSSGSIGCWHADFAARVWHW